MTLTKATYSMIEGSPVNVLDYGADNTGVADSAAAIQAAIDAAVASGGAGAVYIPAGTYVTTAPINIYGRCSVFGAGINKTIIKPDASVLEAVQIGNVVSQSNAHTGEVRNFSVDRVTYDGATDNGGFVFYWTFSSSFYDLESREYKYNFWFKPGNGQAVAYTSLFNMVAIGGFYNVYHNVSGTGYANEITFFGGRLFTRAVTDTQVHWNGGSNNRFVAVSAEGSGTQAFYIGGAGNFVEHPRTEGTWSADDIVISATALRTFVLAHTFYTTITDNGTGTSYITHNDGSQFNSTLNSIPAVTLRYQGATDTTILPIYSSRDNETSFAWAAIRASDGLVRGSLSTNGVLFAGRSLRAGQSAWNFTPLILGAYYLWVDSTGDLRIKNGAPTSETDGTVVGTQT